MKKFFFALIGLGMLLASCEKAELSEEVGSGIGIVGNFNVNVLTKWKHRFPHRGNEPLEVLQESYTFTKDEGKGLISTNYGDIPIRFPRINGMKVSSRQSCYLLTYDHPFFLHGGHIILQFSVGNTIIKTDSISYDIIATDDYIKECRRRRDANKNKKTQ